ncbi:MAG: hypothetical protein LBQ54_09580 [Planctomycetaceae bacterium]|jgi:hypothetical protein|nr:hypothetical protein [Planctomycetaceae bacterium]
MSHKILSFGFQRTVACLLLAAFTPVGIVSDGLHLFLPDMGSPCCHWNHDGHFGDPTPEKTQKACSRSHNHATFPDTNPQNREQNPQQQHSDDYCSVCSFCSSFQCPFLLPFAVQETEICSPVAALTPIPLSCEAFLTLHARAPPLV